MSENRRTTILLRPGDQENLKAISEMAGTSEAETIRRALAVFKEVIENQRSGGSLLLKRPNGAEERVKFF